MKAAQMNQMGLLSRMLLPKVQQKPEGHPLVQDKEGGEWQKCETNEDILKGTKQKHSNWMGRTKAKRECHYLSIKEDEIGPCGILIELD
jgi:hypothetical protein